MSFSYLGTLATDRDRIRFHIQDTAYGAGPKPADGSFTDEELDGLVTLEGTWQRAVAAAFEILATAWAKHVDFEADAISVRQQQTAEHYRTIAKEWRGRFGYGSNSVGYRSVTRIDGYSSDLDNMDV